MRPFFPYYGSKWNISRYYPKPTHPLTIEPFAGAAGYSTFHDLRNVHLYDLDPVISGLWQYLIKVTTAEISSLPELPSVGDSVDDHPSLPQEAKWLIGFWLNRGSASPKKSRTAYSARSDKAQLNWGQKAKERIISQLEGIRDWKVTHGGYDTAPDIEATWFVDPPYVEKGKFYRYPFTKYSELGQWSLQRQGQLIACEGPGADWLPFKTLGDFKSSKGHAKEFLFVRD